MTRSELARWSRVRLGEAVGLGFRRFAQRRRRTEVAHVLSAARAIMSRKRYCLLVTGGAHEPSARVVEPSRPSEDLTVHLGVSPTSRKAREITETGRALLVYERDSVGAYAAARCTAHLVDDPSVRRRQFKPYWRAFWPGGADDGFVVVRCVPYELEVWDPLRGITPAPFGHRAMTLIRDHDRWEHRAIEGPGPG